jgi:serine phosphatase RsbU (regulator of sigma subunit)
MHRLNVLQCHTQDIEARPFDGFMCLALAVLDVETGELEYSSAGTEPMIIIRNHCAEEVTGGGMPLGVSRDERYDPAFTQLDIGDLVLLLTDGITEARCGHNFLGSNGVATIAARNAAMTDLQAVTEAILSDVREYAGGRLQDDACILTVRRV